MAEENTAVQINFDIIEKRQAPPLTVTGAFGGVSAQAAVVAHLYIEYPDVPKHGVVQFDPKTGTILRNEMTIRKGQAIREVVQTLVLAPDVADSLGQWLKDQAVLANKALAERK